MNYIKEARLLVQYIECLDSFTKYYVENTPVYNHIGALFTDIVLQSGLNYKSVVKPRVQNILKKYPEANTVRLFSKLIDEVGVMVVMNWKHPIKLQRMRDIVDFSKNKYIDTCEDLKFSLAEESNRKSFLDLNGFGYKTLDYTLKLLSIDTVAVDRHIVSFVSQAGLNHSDYHQVKSIVEYAADLMEINRTSMDYSIWKYMSETRKSNPQFLLNFNG